MRQGQRARLKYDEEDGKWLKSMLRTQHGTATNYYGDACLCAWHPCGKDTIISFRLIVSQHYCFMTVGMMYAPRVAIS
jgi:hypothetical protein